MCIDLLAGGLRVWFVGYVLCPGRCTVCNVSRLSFFFSEVCPFFWHDDGRISQGAQMKVVNAPKYELDKWGCLPLLGGFNMRFCTHDLDMRAIKIPNEINFFHTSQAFISFFLSLFSFFCSCAFKKICFYCILFWSFERSMQQCVAVPVVVSLSEQVLQNSKSLIRGRWEEKKGYTLPRNEFSPENDNTFI